MRVRQLLESSSPLSKVWKGETAERLMQNLESADDENQQMFARMMMKAINRHADNEPEKLFALVVPLINTVKKIPFGETREFTELLLGSLVKAVTEIGGSTLQAFVEKVSPAVLDGWIPHKLRLNYALQVKKLKRTSDEEDFDKKNDQFVFIGRPAFKEVPEGSGNFKKTLEIENMVKIDRFDASAHQMVHMMKLRASFQGENSEVYTIELPKGLMKGGQPPEELLDLIDTHKRKVTH